MISHFGLSTLGLFAMVGSLVYTDTQTHICYRTVTAYRYECIEYKTTPSGTTYCSKTRKVEYTYEQAYACSGGGAVSLVTPQKRTATSVSGVLNQTATAGGKLQGWVLDLGSPHAYGGAKTKSIIVDPGTTALSGAQGKHVTLVGDFAWLRRAHGLFPVLKVKSVTK